MASRHTHPSLSFLPTIPTHGPYFSVFRLAITKGGPTDQTVKANLVLARTQSPTPGLSPKLQNIRHCAAGGSSEVPWSRWQPVPPMSRGRRYFQMYSLFSQGVSAPCNMLSSSQMILGLPRGHRPEAWGTHAVWRCVLLGTHAF